MNHAPITGRMSASQPAYQEIPRFRTPQEQQRFGTLRNALHRMAYPEHFRRLDQARAHNIAKRVLGNPGSVAQKWETGLPDYFNSSLLDLGFGEAMRKSAVARAVDELAPRPAQMPELPPVICAFGDIFDLG